MRNLSKTLIRIFITSTMAIAFAYPSQAQIVKGEKSLGPKVGYVSKNKSAIAGLVFQYSFSNHFRISPELSYVFRNNDMDAFSFDINAHVPFGFTGEKVAFYPLAGLNYSSWSRHYRTQGTECDSSDDVSTRTARFGMNLGAGFDLRCSESLKLSLEAKYVLMKGYSTAVITAGIAYVF